MNAVLRQLTLEYFPYFFAKQEHYTNMIFVKLELPNYLINRDIYKQVVAPYVGYDINKYGVLIEWG